MAPPTSLRLINAPESLSHVIMGDELDLKGAYSLETPEDSRRLYGAWAESYDETFAEKMDYQSPRNVALAYLEAGGRGNVLDVGAGTGLGGEALRELGVTPVHALDLSPEMLEQARKKAVYDQLIAGDITATLDIPDATFDGVVSAGTFTNGHVGPEGLDELIRIAKPGALFALTIHFKHFETAGFAAKFEALRGSIKGLFLREMPAYGPNAKGEHKDDTVHIALFVRA